MASTRASMRRYSSPAGISRPRAVQGGGPRAPRQVPQQGPPVLAGPSYQQRQLPPGRRPPVWARPDIGQGGLGRVQVAGQAELLVRVDPDGFVGRGARARPAGADGPNRLVSDNETLG